MNNCPSTKPYVNNKTCVASCIIDLLFLDNNTCVVFCPNDLYDVQSNGEKLCVSNCSPKFVDGDKCVLECNQSAFLNQTDNHCISEDKCDHFYQVGLVKYCVDKCPPSFPYLH